MSAEEALTLETLNHLIKKRDEWFRSHPNGHYVVFPKGDTVVVKLHDGTQVFEEEATTQEEALGRAIGASIYTEYNRSA
jgi:hypothetical protein